MFSLPPTGRWGFILILSKIRIRLGPLQDRGETNCPLQGNLSNARCSPTSSILSRCPAVHAPLRGTLLMRGLTLRINHTASIVPNAKKAPRIPQVSVQTAFGKRFIEKAASVSLMRTRGPELQLLHKLPWDWFVIPTIRLPRSPFTSRGNAQELFRVRDISQSAHAANRIGSDGFIEPTRQQ